MDKSELRAAAEYFDGREHETLDRAKSTQHLRMMVKHILSTVRSDDGEPVTVDRGSPWEFAVDWYKVDQIHHTLNSNDRRRGPIPEDHKSREFAEWMAHEYALAMHKGIEIGREWDKALLVAENSKPVTVEKLEAWGGVARNTAPITRRTFYRADGKPISCMPVGDWTDIVRCRNTVGEMRHTLTGLGIELKGGA
jgi:hypothetical protein